MKKHYNKASIDILMVLSLRDSLSQHEEQMLKDRLSVSAQDSNKAKNLLRAQEYLRELSQVQIDPSLLPAPLPIDHLFVEKLRHFNGKHLKFIAILLIVVSSLVISIWSYETSREYRQTLAEVTYTKDLAFQLKDSESVNVTADQSSKLPSESRDKELKKTYDLDAFNRVQSSKLEFLPTQNHEKTDLSIKVTKRDSIIAAADIRKPNAEASNQNTLSPSGFVIRATLDLSSVEQPKQKVLDFLSAFKVEKAGQVELGWQKNPNLFYYHFFTQERFEPAIKEGLMKLGKLIWSKEPHPRKLAVGQSRIILQVKVKESP